MALLLLYGLADQVMMVRVSVTVVRKVDVKSRERQEANVMTVARTRDKVDSVDRRVLECRSCSEHQRSARFYRVKRIVNASNADHEHSTGDRGVSEAAVVKTVCIRVAHDAVAIDKLAAASSADLGHVCVGENRIAQREVHAVLSVSDAARLVENRKKVAIVVLVQVVVMMVVIFSTNYDLVLGHDRYCRSLAVVVVVVALAQSYDGVVAVLVVTVYNRVSFVVVILSITVDVTPSHTLGTALSTIEIYSLVTRASRFITVFRNVHVSTLLGGTTTSTMNAHNDLLLDNVLVVVVMVMAMVRIGDATIGDAVKCR